MKQVSPQQHKWGYQGKCCLNTGNCVVDIQYRPWNPQKSHHQRRIGFEVWNDCSCALNEIFLVRLARN
ncbi:MAG: hypothetical protein V3U88_06930 [Methylococcales bacterium]